MVLQILQMLEARTPPVKAAQRFDFDDPEFVHYYAEAGRLAQADRFQYLGDPGFVHVPTAELVAPAYVRERARLIDPERRTREVKAGAVNTGAAASLSGAAPVSDTADATSQLAIVDAAGNALSMTTTINLNFGSRLMVNGFVLNNALTNFSAAPGPGQAAPRSSTTSARV